MNKIIANKNTQLIFSIVVFAISALFFINADKINNKAVHHGECHSCGTIESCMNGEEQIPTDIGYEECEIVPGVPPCKVTGLMECNI
jgi:hypothetical protein